MNINNHEYLTVAEIKTYLNISQSAAYQLVKRKDFPVTHIAGSIRVPTKLFFQWLAHHTNIPAGMNGAV